MTPDLQSQGSMARDAADFVVRLYSIYRSRKAGGDPSLTLSLAEELVTMVRALAARLDGSVAIAHDGKECLVGGVRPYPDPVVVEQAEALAKVMASLGLGALVFDPSATPQGAVELMAALVDKSIGVESSYPGVRFVEQTTDDDRHRTARADRHAVRAWSLLVTHVGVAMEAVASGRPLPLEGLRRAVAEVAGVATTHAPALVFMATAPGRSRSQASHLAATSVISLLLGMTFDLEPSLLLDLGVLAALSDLRLAVVKKLEVLDDPGRFTIDGATRERLGIATVERLLGLGTTRDVLEVALVNHAVRRLDEPRAEVLEEGSSLSLLRDIIEVSAALDALRTWGSKTGSVPMAEAIRRLVKEGRARFPSAILRGLLRLVGPYPIGSVIRLDDGRRAVVVSVDASAPGMPTISVWPEGPQGMPDPGGMVTSGPGGVTIERSLDTLEEGIAIARFFSARPNEPEPRRAEASSPGAARAPHDDGGDGDSPSTDGLEAPSGMEPLGGMEELGGLDALDGLEELGASIPTPTGSYATAASDGVDDPTGGPPGHTAPIAADTKRGPAAPHTRGAQSTYAVVRDDD